MDAVSGTKANSMMSEQQKSIIIRAERRLMAPCCYTQTIDIHASEIAGQMRTEVVQMVLSGLDEVAIYAHYKARYGEQILAVPDGITGQLAFAIPTTVAALATGLLTFILYRFHRRTVAIASTALTCKIGPLTAEEQAIQDEIRRATAW